jgi:hypothetical protein
MAPSITYHHTIPYQRAAPRLGQKGRRKWRAELCDTEVAGIALAILPGPEDPVAITRAIMADLHATQEPRSRYSWLPCPATYPGSCARKVLMHPFATQIRH